jgi:hypothetical protein
MILQFGIGDGNILNCSGTVLIVEIVGKCWKFSQIFSAEYEKKKNLNEFIYVYAEKNNKNRNILLAVVNDNSDMSEYCRAITTLLEVIYQKSGKIINFYLPGVSNFNDLAAAVSMFCEKHMDYNYCLKFFTEEENLSILKYHLDILQKSINARKAEISGELFDKFRCFCCKNFAYQPSIFMCCSLVVCLRCSRLKYCPSCKESQIAEPQKHLINVFSGLPYYCYCGTRMVFSEKLLHCKNCEICWFVCTICNQPISYSKAIQHIRDNHVEHVFLDNVF